MSKPRRDLDYLLDIQEAINRSLEYTSGKSWEEYQRDYKTQDAVVRNLEIIGEATKNLSNDLCNKYTSIPWRDLAGTRDRLVHHYFGINQEIVWQIIQRDLPDLNIQIARLINNLSAERG